MSEPGTGDASVATIAPPAPKTKLVIPPLAPEYPSKPEFLSADQPATTEPERFIPPLYKKDDPRTLKLQEIVEEIEEREKKTYRNWTPEVGSWRRWADAERILAQRETAQAKEQIEASLFHPEFNVVPKGASSKTELRMPGSTKTGLISRIFRKISPFK